MAAGSGRACWARWRGASPRRAMPISISGRWSSIPSAASIRSWADGSSPAGNGRWGLSPSTSRPMPGPISAPSSKLARQRRKLNDARLMTDRVLILDFGSQVTQLIARRIREAGVYCEIMPFNTDPQKIAEFAPKAIIFSGGPASVTEIGTPRAPEIAFEMGVPLLGICYGHQTLCAQLGGEVEPSDHREFGRAFVEVIEDCA